MNWKIAAMVLVLLSGLVSLSPVVEEFRTWLLGSSRRRHVLAIGVLLLFGVVAAVVVWGGEFLGQVWQWGKEGLWWKLLLGFPCMAVAAIVMLESVLVFSRGLPYLMDDEQWERGLAVILPILIGLIKENKAFLSIWIIGTGVMFVCIGWGFHNAALPILAAGLLGGTYGAAVLPVYVFRTLRRLFHTDTAIYGLGVLLLIAASAIQIFVLAP